MEINYNYEGIKTEINKNQIKSFLKEIISKRDLYLKSESLTIVGDWKYKLSREVGDDGLYYYHIYIFEETTEDCIVYICTISNARVEEVEELYNQAEILNFDFGIIT